MQKPQLARCLRASKPDSLPIEFPAAPGASGAAEGKIQQRGFSCCVCTCFRSSPLFGVPYNTYYNRGTESHQFGTEPPFAARPPQAWTERGAFSLPAHSTPGNVFHSLLRPGAPLTPLQRYSKGSVLASLRTTFTSGKASCRRQAISAAMGHSVP